MVPEDLDIRREGRRWRGPEARARYSHTPEKIEMYEGRRFFSEEERITMLALLLENVGIDRVVELGPLDLWEAAVADCRRGPSS